MRFKASILDVRMFSKLTAALNSLGPRAWVKLSEQQVCFTIDPQTGTQVWAALQVDVIFENINIQSAHRNIINLEVPLSALNRALRSAQSATSATIRLTKKDNIPVLALTIVNTTSSNALPTVGNRDDDLDALSFGAGADTRETIVTQEIPVRVIPPEQVEHLHEPLCRDSDVHIILPPLMQLKSISDRFTKLALAENKSGSSSSASTRLEISANAHGCLKMSIRSDAMSINSVWTDLTNADLDPSTVEGGDLANHPSTHMRLLGTADGRSDQGWSTVRIDGRDWGKVMSVGRLGGRVIACFSHDRSLVIYVYLTNPQTGGESVITYFLTSYSA